MKSASRYLDNIFQPPTESLLIDIKRNLFSLDINNGGIEMWRDKEKKHVKYIQKYQQWWERKCGEIKPYSFCPGLLLKQTQEEESFTFFIEGAVFIKKSARL